MVDDIVDDESGDIILGICKRADSVCAGFDVFPVPPLSNDILGRRPEPASSRSIEIA